MYDDDNSHNSNNGKNITTVQPVFFEKRNRHVNSQINNFYFLKQFGVKQ